MHHPQRQPRLLEVGEAEIPGEILRVDHVADAKGQRLTPSHDLPADEQREWSRRVLPVCVPDDVLVIVVRHVGQTTLVFESVGRLVDHPSADEESVVAV